MDTIFLKVLNMSTGACYVIAAVLLARLLLRRAPKIYSYLLWAVVGFRLCCPFSFRSVFSLFSVKPLQSTLSAGYGVANPVFFPDVYDTLEQVAAGTESLELSGVLVMNPSLTGGGGNSATIPPEGTMSVSTGSILDLVVLIWFAGIAVLLIYGLISYLCFNRKLRRAVCLKDNVWQSDWVKSPFILGIIRPKIYIPFGLSEEALSYVLMHEHIHLRRKDHLVKAFACLVLSVHWFNPLVWLAFHLMNKDMEMSCDERVLKEMDTGSGDEKKGYSMSLLAFASNQRFYVSGPLAFGESAVKSRIKNVLRWKKPQQWMIVCALVFCLVVTAACAANPPGEEREQKLTGQVVAEVWGYRITDDWLGYWAAFMQAVGHESPVDGAMEAVMEHLWVDSKVVYEDVTQAEIDAYVKRTVESFESVSEEEMNAYFAAFGFTYEEWKNHYLPQYDARAVLIAEKAEQRAAELQDESLLQADLEEMNLEIRDEAAVSALRKKYPGIHVSIDEITDVVAAWAKEENVQEYEICSTITSTTGKTKQVYIKTKQDSTDCYVWLVLEKKDDGTWAAGDFSKKTLSEAAADLKRAQFTVLSEGEDNVTAFAFQNLCLFPEADRSNFGVVEIDRTEGNESVGVNLHQGLQVNQIDGPGPGFSFKADMKDPEQPVITMSQFLYNTPDGSGPGAMGDVIPELYYGKFDIPVERLREMATLLYEYVPLYVAMQ